MFGILASEMPLGNFAELIAQHDHELIRRIVSPPRGFLEESHAFSHLVEGYRFRIHSSIYAYLNQERQGEGKNPEQSFGLSMTWVQSSPKATRLPHVFPVQLLVLQ